MNRIELQKALETRFNVTELRNICFKLGINYENLSPQLSALARELLLYCERTNQIPNLIHVCQELRPQFNDWKYNSDLFNPDPLTLQTMKQEKGFSIKLFGIEVFQFVTWISILTALFLVGYSVNETVKNRVTPTPTITVSPTTQFATTPTVSTVLQTETLTSTPISTPSNTPTITAEIAETVTSPTVLPSATVTENFELVTALTSINVRNGPGSEFEITSVLFEGASARMLAKSTNFENDLWYLIQLENNSVGWVSSIVFEVPEPQSAKIPIAVTIPPTPSPEPPPDVFVDTVTSNQVFISWKFHRSLKDDEFFTVRVWPTGFENEKIDVVRQKEPFYTLEVDKLFINTKEFNVSVAVINSPFLDVEDETFTVISESESFIFPILEPTLPSRPSSKSS